MEKEKGREGRMQTERNRRATRKEQLCQRKRRESNKICLNIVPDFKSYLCFSIWKTSLTEPYKTYLLPHMYSRHVRFPVSAYIVVNIQISQKPVPTSLHSLYEDEYTSGCLDLVISQVISEK